MTNLQAVSESHLGGQRNLDEDDEEEDESEPGILRIKADRLL